jgi:DNA-directed RNA polymerase omega subunit
MAYVSLEKLLDKTDSSVFKLVVLASKRALEIAEGQPKLTDSLSVTVKPSIIALQEIVEGKIKAKELKS